MPTTAVMGTVGLIGAGSSLIGAGEQSSAAENAADLQASEQQQALNFQEQEWSQQQQNEAPYLAAGKGAVAQLSDLLGPGGGLTGSYPGGQFTPPTLQQAEQYPGYQFQEQQGEQAIQNQASAQGELLDPNEQRAMVNYAQNAAQSDYGNVYSQAQQTYATQYNQWMQQQAKQYNQLAGLAGTGQTAVGQLGQEGQATAGNVGNIMLTGGAQIGQDIQNAAYQTASGYQGAANSASGIGNMLLLQSMLGQGGGSGGITSADAANTVPEFYG